MSGNFGLPKKSDNLSAYELERLENIKFVQDQLGGAFVNFGSAKNLVNSIQQKSEVKKTKRRAIKRKSQTQYVRRSARIRNDENKSNYNERSDGDSDDEKPKKKFRQGSLIVKFPWVKNKENEEYDKIYYSGLNDGDFISDEGIDFYGDKPVKQQRISNKPPVQLPVSQITPEMIKNVHYSSSGKQYSTEGTTCHQCRQKTLDQKSYCRRNICRGIRGMFCGFCLGNRYGENVGEVLLLKQWACPPCRGYCNCSICRRREGKPPTGQLAQQAHAQGFKSVRHLLVEIEGENPTSLTSDDDEEKENISGDCETKNEDISTSHEKSNDIEIDNSHSESMSDLNLNFGSESNSDDVYFEEYVKIPSFL